MDRPIRTAMPVSLERTVRFRATHHYRCADWSEEKNRAVFGENTEPHEHDWELRVTVEGEPDHATGFVVDLAALDDVVRREVVERLEGRSLNEALAEIGAGAMQPSTENLARWIYERLAPRLPGAARLVRVRIAENDALAAEYEG